MTLACKIHGARDLRLEPEEPPPLAPHEVELRLGAAGICGSDLHYYLHGRVGAFVIREPLIPGHEASAVVLRTGGAVTRVRAGMKVAINPSHPCGRCDYCRAGRDNLCRDMRFLGSASVYPHVQGMFRERFIMGERQLTPVDEDISLGELACAEPLSIGLHGVNRAGSLLGKTVLVTGGGTIGCMTVMAARLAGAARIVVADIAERPLQMARQVGADDAVRADAAAVGDLADLADVAIEAAGSPAALGTCLAAVRRGGRIVQVGTLPAEGMPFPANDIMARELDYVGAFRAGIEFDWAVTFLRTRRVDVRPLMSAQLPLERAVEAFELAADRARSTKVQLVCES
ncbi:L-idonate 5-dehydrogenase [Bordetella genomosp. 2]|uniref:L-idonate 5-dehydrogenase n=1 Tax=Bordetella genomosp. 2 TaxID=1983456 RepID=A0A261VIA8_9BORD|nr:L-idonate 5-dehydrogenase [Bordetella genomosp. 2]OZI73886.1 L-idonate 5-dehydrogenase [Bordetella genomosp. 2]